MVFSAGEDDDRNTGRTLQESESPCGACPYVAQEFRVRRATRENQSAFVSRNRLAYRLRKGAHVGSQIGRCRHRARVRADRSGRLAVILDTNAVSGLLGGDRALEKILARADRHQLPVIVIGEYRFGILRSRKEARLQSLLDRLISNSYVLSIELETTSVYAEIRNRLHRNGTPIPQNDLWVAALAVQHREPLISRDAHFDYVPGLRRLSWSP